MIYDEGSDIWYTEYHGLEHKDVKFSLKLTEVLAMEQTPFQKIVVMHNQTFGNFFTLDGFLQLSERDEFIYHDMICHPAMAVNPDIRRVLIIGGGDGGTAREVARYHHIEKIDLVEIDERVVRLCQQFIPQTAAVFENEPRLHLFFDDGVAFVANAADASYDLIIVDSTDPFGVGEGLFSHAFYRDCYRILSEGGILINQHEGAFYAPDAQEMLRAHEKIRSVFPIAEVYGFNQPVYASGYWYIGFASKKYHPVRDQQAAIWERFGLQTRYYNSALHGAAFALPTYVRDILGK